MTSTTGRWPKPARLPYPEPAKTSRSRRVRNSSQIATVWRLLFWCWCTASRLHRVGAAHRRVHLHVVAAARPRPPAHLEVASLGGQVRLLLELGRPITQRVAKPGRFGLQRRQAKALPQLARPLHVLTLG